MLVNIQGNEFTISGTCFSCSLVKPTQIKDLLRLWANRILTLEEGKSAYLPLMGDRVDVFPSLYCLKATRQGERIWLYGQEAIDPLYDAREAQQDGYWLWIFSEIEAVQLSPSWVECCQLGNYDRLEWVDALVQACPEAEAGHPN